MSSTCPLCGELIEKNFNYCQLCGCRLIQCQSCGNLNVNTFKFCQSCGKAMQFQTGLITGPSITRERSKSIESGRNNSIDQKVYDHLVLHKGKISWSNASKELNMSVKDLKNSVDKLIKEGKITAQESNIQQPQNNAPKQSKDISTRVQTTSNTRPQYRQNFPVRYPYNLAQNQQKKFGLSELLEKIDGKKRIERFCPICTRPFKGTGDQVICLRCAILHPRFKRNH